MRGRKNIVSALGLGIALIGVIWWRGSKPERGSIERLADAAQVVFARMPMKSFGGIDDGLRTLELAPVENEALCTPQQAEAICVLVAQFIQYYYVAESPQEYIRWRESQGDMIATPDVMATDPFFRRAFAAFQQKGLITPQMGGHDIFAAIWADTRRGTVKGLSSDGVGLLRIFKLLTATDLKPPHLEGRLGYNVWVGGRSTMGTNWWPTDEFDHILKRDGSVLGGYLAAVVEFETGQRAPMIWCCYWHPDQQRWRLRAVLLNNLKDYSVLPPQI